MNNLDKLIQENREKFDGTEPLDGHFERFRERLGYVEEKETRTPSRYSLLKVAAIILVIITGSVVVFDQAAKSVRDRYIGKEDSQLTAEMAEAVQYYDARAMARMKDVHRLTSDPVQADRINEEALKEMQVLDENTSELQKSLAENPNCERLQAAIIQNQQMKEGVMNTIINQLSKH
ncbi:MAG: hypothetical protein WCO02_13915 [Bacteroidota bacterium]